MPLNYGLITKKPELEYKFSDGTTETVKDLLAKTFDNTVDFSNAYTIVEVTKESLIIGVRFTSKEIPPFTFYIIIITKIERKVKFPLYFLFSNQ